MNERVDIVMATYNGMPYIREQLQSILWQDYPQLRLLIHDDGSTDGTVEEIRKVAERYPEKVFFIEDGITFRDAKKNFEHLLKMTDADYIFLADQDDVWLPSKVSAIVEEMYNLEQAYGKDTPVLVFSDYALIDEAGYTLSPSIKALWKIDPTSKKATSLELLLSRSIAPGCATGFNKFLLKLCLPIPDEALMHDIWLLLMASALGIVKYLPFVFTLYRQHGANTIGVKNQKFLSKLIRIAKAPGQSIGSFAAAGPRNIAQARALLIKLEELGFGNADSAGAVRDYIEYRTGGLGSKLVGFPKYAVDGFSWELARLFLWREKISCRLF